ncbi:hypothetical protein MLD38_025992 [Melastoma candidum]|uniref:Uncharacterized protein n=1 Tax=Melastoma candidum TaxID=119954 RepID=A0ACB9NX75_9MYRT|nr:hypothetical protein MLD38_025992 [Melastoma candidum]
MSGYPQPPPNYGYGPPPSQYPSSSSSSGGISSATSTSTPYASPYAPPPSAPYAPSPQYHQQQQQQHQYTPQGVKPPKDKPQPHPYSSSSYGGGYDYHAGAPPPPPPPYGSPFAALTPSQFPPGTDPNVVACFQIADNDRSGFIDDNELQRALSSYNQSFSLRTVRLLMYMFTRTNTRKIGPKEFVSVFYGLQNWRAIFERFDRDRSGKIDANELREALLSLGFSVSPTVLELLVSKYDKTGGRYNGIEYDNFIECCLIVKGLTEKFKEKDTAYTGSATFTYEAFMLAVLPFLIA